MVSSYDDNSSYSEEDLKPPASMRDDMMSQYTEDNEITSQNIPDGENGTKISGQYIGAGEVLRHVQELESKAQDGKDYNPFGHPEPPQLYMCRIAAKEKGIVALMAVTRHCVSAQLVKETLDGMSTEGPPVEVLVMKGDDHISCASILLLELPKLSAEDKQLVPYQKNQGLSLMSGGMVPIAPTPRVAMVVGTTHSRVISVEFSVKIRSLSLTRRNFYAGKEVLTFFEPLPFGTLASHQRSQRRAVAGPKGEKSRRIVPFEPSHGVCTIVPYSTIRKGKAVTYVWLSYGDGTAVRLHHAAFFASVIQKHSESQPTEKSLENILGINVVRWEARLPPLEGTSFTLVPVPKYHPSPFAPFPTWQKPQIHEVTGVRVDPAAVPSRREMTENFEALVYCYGAMAENFPTLAFYTSEDQFEGRKEVDDDDVEEAGTGSILSSVVYGIYGMLTGGTSSSKPIEQDPVEEQEITDSSQAWDPKVPFPSLNLDPYRLYAGSEIHDPPRQITFCTVEPDGNLAAIADTLGRVSLVDLSTKQIVRMWKGLRDTTCCWLEVPRKSEVKPGQTQKILYLVIHSRQRRIVEIWRTRNGPKVKSLSVAREAQLLTVRELSRFGYISTCYLAHSNMPHSRLNKIQRIVVEEDESAGMTSAERNSPLRPKLTMAPQDAAARLNQMMQLLSDTNVECQSIDVYKALERIVSIEDLSVALDTLASSPTLEQKMGEDGSTFQRLAIRHCKVKLDEAISDSGRDALTNPHVQRLAFKIAYYDQVVKAYDVIHAHERRPDAGIHSSNVGSPSSWGLEAIGWTSVYEKITKTLIDDGIPLISTTPMLFYEFASSLEPPKKYLEEDYDLKNSGYQVYFSDSTKTRREILARVFKPLLGDVFSFGSVSQVFDALGTRKDGEYVLKCFGEWFASLSVKEVIMKAIFAKGSPVKRWLQEYISYQLEDQSINANPPMEAIYQYCRHSDELVRGFWLATLCHESISQVGGQKEEQTYGKVSKESLARRWEDLLRQLRVCLLVYLRLHGIQLGPLPITVHDIEKCEEFSPFQWLAHDELLMSHNHEEIVSLEEACRYSSHAFDASTSHADAPAKWKALQSACLACTLSADERSEHLVDFGDDDRLGALLLYMKPHNVSTVLIAHRALLLGALWGKQPQNLDILKDAVVAMQGIDTDELKRIAYAVRLEIWQTHIRPVFRALMFGFDDVQEISPDVISPLFQRVEWVEAFSAITSAVLEMLNEFEWHDVEVLNLREEYLEIPESDGDGSWPPLVECPILHKLVERNKKMKPSAFEAHKMLLAALRVTQDFPKLARSIPSFYELFTVGSLFKKAVAIEDAEENQQALMQDAVVAYARNYNGPCLDTLELHDIEVLSELFEFEMDNIRTLFLLAMYEFGKDRFVDEVITRSSQAISVAHFCDGGVEIICRRLDYLINVNPTSEMRSIMSTLDANMCEWIKEKAENSESLVGAGNMTVPIGNTHLFALRLLSLGASADIDKKERIKIHSLIVLSGSIVKGLESLQPKERSSFHDPRTGNVPRTPDDSLQGNAAMHRTTISGVQQGTTTNPRKPESFNYGGGMLSDGGRGIAGGKSSDDAGAYHQSNESESGSASESDYESLGDSGLQMR